MTQSGPQATILIALANDSSNAFISSNAGRNFQ
jgi:hypothetical protein